MSSVAVRGSFAWQSRIVRSSKEAHVSTEAAVVQCAASAIKIAVLRPNALCRLSSKFGGMQSCGTVQACTQCQGIHRLQVNNFIAAYCATSNVLHIVCCNASTRLPMHILCRRLRASRRRRSGSSGRFGSWSESARSMAMRRARAPPGTRRRASTCYAARQPCVACLTLDTHIRDCVGCHCIQNAKLVSASC